MSVLNTLNPIKLKCTSCKSSIHLEKISAFLSAAILLIFAFVVIGQYYGSPGFLIKVLLPTALAIEVIYFLLIRFSIIKITASK